jgi:hypothetical protein
MLDISMSIAILWHVMGKENVFETPLVRILCNLCLGNEMANGPWSLPTITYKKHALCMKDKHLEEFPDHVDGIQVVLLEEKVEALK